MHPNACVDVQVEDQLYSLPKQTLRGQSDVFDGMFMHDSDSREGQSDDNPIILEGYKCADFDSLLRVLITRQVYSAVLAGQRTEPQIKAT